MLSRTLALASLSLLGLGCPSGGDPADDVAVSLQFAARIGGEDAACGTSYAGVGTTSETLQLQDLRFFVSAVHLVDTDGNEIPVTLDQETDWQHDDVALLDFEDGTGPCAETGTPSMNSVVSGVVAAGEYNGLVFDLGVPFELNHIDAATAPAPLNLIAMQWNWQGGYKFARVDTTNSNAAPNNRWFFHLGSTGCESDAATVAPASECAKPNRPRYSFDAFDAATDTVVFDLGDLLADTDVSANTPDTPPGCMSFPADVTDCAEVFPNLGLDWDTGACTNGCDQQTLFTVE